MKTIARFFMLCVGFFLFVAGWLAVYISIVAEIVWMHAIVGHDNLVLFAIGAVLVLSGWLLFRNVLEDDLRDES